MNRPTRLIIAAIAAFAILTGPGLAVVTPASAATLAATTTCSNGVDNTPGLGLICEVTIANTITPTGGSATITVRECHGAAGDPEADCTTETTELTEPVTAVDQCNDATNGGGGTLRCTVDITNDYVGVTPTITAATVNQCVGSGDGITIGCDPFPATTTGAAITQCNGSANGGTLVELTCTANGTQAGPAQVTVNQCNDSTNGGGALVICSATMVDNVVGASTPPSSTTGPDVEVTPPSTDTLAAEQTGTPSGQGVLAIILALGALATVLILSAGGARRRS
jgi:hypothetical protein